MEKNMDRKVSQEEVKDLVVAHALVGLDGLAVLKPSKYERTMQDWMSESAQERSRPKAPEEI
jgi:hypothetical protein